MDLLPHRIYTHTTFSDTLQREGSMFLLSLQHPPTREPKSWNCTTSQFWKECFTQHSYKGSLLILGELETYYSEGGGVTLTEVVRHRAVLLLAYHPRT